MSNTIQRTILTSTSGGDSYLVTPKIIDKWWGYERIYHNDELYCMKELFFKHKNTGTSLHFHINKTETLLVTSGKLKVLYKDLEGATSQFTLYPGQALTIAPGFLHQLVACTDNTTVIEASTKDEPIDSIRVEQFRME